MSLISLPLEKQNIDPDYNREGTVLKKEIIHRLSF